MNQRYVRIQVGKVNIVVKDSYITIKCMLCDDCPFIEVTQIISYWTGPIGSGEQHITEHKVMVNKTAISLISSNEGTTEIQ